MKQREREREREREKEKERYVQIQSEFQFKRRNNVFEIPRSVEHRRERTRNHHEDIDFREIGQFRFIDFSYEEHIRLFSRAFYFGLEVGNHIKVSGCHGGGRREV